MLVTVSEYKAAMSKNDKSDDVITKGLSTAQQVVQGFLRYDVETEFSTSCPDAIKLTIMLICQSIMNNIGVGGIANSLSLGQQGSIQFDNTKYFKYLDLIKTYKKPENVF